MGFILQYDSDYDKSLIKFKNDLYVFFNTLNDELMEDEIYGYTNSFIKYFNKIFKLIKNFDNDIGNLNYDVEFIIIFDSDVPTISLCTILLNPVSLKSLCLNISGNIENTSNKIKKSDYDKLTQILNFNYLADVNIYPYCIVKIAKIDYNIYLDDFYIGKLILLKNTNSAEEIEINFDSNSLFIYNSEELDKFEEIEPNGFKFHNGKLIIFDGPVFKITKIDLNYVKLDEQIYKIDSVSTIDINDLI
jgi:hypothetical protein